MRPAADCLAKLPRKLTPLAVASSADAPNPNAKIVESQQLHILDSGRLVRRKNASDRPLSIAGKLLCHPFRSLELETLFRHSTVVVSESM